MNENNKDIKIPSPSTPRNQFPENQDFLNLDGFIQIFETVPTLKPKNIASQFVLVSGGGSTRAYLYDIKALAWRSVALT